MAGDPPRYREWSRRREAERLAAASNAEPVSGLEIDLLLVVDQPDPTWLSRCLASIAGQTTHRWQLLVSVIGPMGPAAELALDAGLASLPPGRAGVRRLPEGTTEPEAAAAAAAAGRAPGFVLLSQHDQMAPDAVALLSAALVGADLVYADEDRVDDRGMAFDPALKPDWSPELYLSSPYVGRPTVLRRDLAATTGGIRPVDGGDWEHDLVLRVTEHTDRVAHVAEVLCHRRAEDDRAEPGYGDGAVVAALSRRGEVAAVDPGPLPGTWYVRRLPAASPDRQRHYPFPRRGRPSCAPAWTRSPPPAPIPSSNCSWSTTGRRSRRPSPCSTASPLAPASRFCAIRGPSTGRRSTTPPSESPGGRYCSF